jgi:hypothetical protein
MRMGDGEVLVEEGDRLYFDASYPHFGEVEGNSEFVGVIVLYSESN